MNGLNFIYSGSQIPPRPSSPFPRNIVQFKGRAVWEISSCSFKYPQIITTADSYVRVRINLDNSDKIDCKVVYSGLGRDLREEFLDLDSPMIMGLRGEHVRFIAGMTESVKLAIQDLENGRLNLNISFNKVVAKKEDQYRVEIQVTNPEEIDLDAIYTADEMEVLRKPILSDGIIWGNGDEKIHFETGVFTTDPLDFPSIHGKILELSLDSKDELGDFVDEIQVKLIDRGSLELKK